jgi:hypothetical protein
MSKEPTKREGLPKSEQGQAEVHERRERGAAGEPLPEDYAKGEYHGLTAEQIKKIEDARYDDTDGAPPIDDGVDAQRAKDAAEAEKAEKKRAAEEAEEAEKAAKKRKE